jgi:riboflavin biosynthesis pyrimidine reductase
LRTPPSSAILSAAAPTVFFAANDAPKRPGWTVERVKAPGGALDLDDVVSRLSKRGVKRLMVEGGPTTLVRFFEEDRVDLATIFMALRTVGAPDAPRLSDAALNLSEFLRLEKADVLGDGLLVTLSRA